MKATLAVPILLCGLLLTTACDRSSTAPDIPSANGGATPTSTAPNAAEDPTVAATNFARCMREHGQAVPDPDPNSEEFRVVEPSDAQNSGWDAAMEACGHLMPNGRDRGPTPSPQELEQLRDFAVCMRSHDIEITDPTPEGNMIIRGRLEHVNRTQLEADPGYQAASAACRDKLPDGGAVDKAKP